MKDDIVKLPPEGVNVYADNPNGRYRISHPQVPGARCSVSWTKRGQEYAMKTVLQFFVGVGEGHWRQSLSIPRRFCCCVMMGVQIQSSIVLLLYFCGGGDAARR